ncbi:hypothetical protein [Angustibacter aerolatus]
MRRVVTGLLAGIGLVVAGATSAQAWTWAASSNPIVMSGGGGYGNLREGVGQATLQSWLRDTKLDDGRVYAHVVVQVGGADVSVIDSGRRSDGERSYARMADRTGALGGGAHHYVVSTCRSTPANDPCSKDKRRT